MSKRGCNEVMLEGEQAWMKRKAVVRVDWVGLSEW